MKMKTIFSAALAAALMALPHAYAVTGGAAATNATAGAATAAAGTNAKPADLVANLFGDPVIAKGAGFEIKQSQLDGVVDAFKAQTASMGQSVPVSELTRTALNTLIANQLLLQQATDADKAKGKKDADQYIEQVIKRYGSQATLEEQLKAAGKTFPDWRNDKTQQATAQAVLIRELNAAPSEAEIQKFYETNSAASQLPEQAHVRHILLLTIDPSTQPPTPLSDDKKQAKLKQINDLLKRARAGEDFAKLAKEYSEDPQTKDDGGELPPFTHGQMVAEFDAAAFSMTNNQISGVITTQYGYHIIKLLDKTPARKLALTDKVPGGDITVAEYFKDRLTAERLQELAPPYIQKLSKSPGVDILDPALKTLMAQTNDLPTSTATPAK